MTWQAGGTGDAPLTALVTGAGSGIGKAITLGLARPGAMLYLAGRRLEALEAVAREVAAKGAQARCCPADLTTDAGIARVSEAVQVGAERLDVLVHSAGMIVPARMEQVSAVDFEQQYRLNLRTPFFLTRSLLPPLRAARGQVVFINSSSGNTARAGEGPYAATKHGLRAVADSLRQEVNREDVRVLSVFVGRTATPMQADLHDREGRPYRPERLMQPEDVATMVLAALALPRTAEVTDIHLRPMIGPERRAG